MLKSSIKALTEGLTLPTESSELSDSSGSVRGGVMETADAEPGKSLCSFARMPLLCLAGELCFGLDGPSWLE